MKTLVLNLKEDSSITSTELPIQDIITLDSSFVDVDNYLDKGDVSTLFQFTHQQNSLLNVTEVSPYILLYFDESRELKGATLSIKSGSGNRTIITQYKYVLFVRMPHDLSLNDIHDFQIEKNKKDVCK